MDKVVNIPIVVAEEFADATECTISVWFVDEGESVRQNERLYELLIPGMSIEINSPSAGVLNKILRQRNATVEPGDIIGWIAPEKE